MTFFIVYRNVPFQACSRLAAADKHGTAVVGSRIRSVTFGTGSPVYVSWPFAAPGGGTNWSTELEPGDAGAFCKDAAVNGVLDLRFDFNR